jgi:hypothetical protein
MCFSGIKTILYSCNRAELELGTENSANWIDSRKKGVKPVYLPNM